VRLLEFESKAILKKYQIVVPDYTLLANGNKVEINKPVVLKAQIPVGGRCKAGGILDVATGQDAKKGIEYLLSASIRGFKAKKILLEEKIKIDREFYMAVLYDTVAKAPVAVFSTEGGVDIEELAVQQPGKVRKEIFSSRTGLPQFRAREMISETGVSGKQLLGLSVILSKLADIFIDYDATIAEINPLALSEDGRLIALDCHLEIDDDAIFRHEDLAESNDDENRAESEKP